MAVIIGTPALFPLGETTTPGAQSLTVPSDATHVAIFFHLPDDASTPNATVSTLTSDFAGTFTINNSSSTTVSLGVSICTALVTSTGAGKTFTPTFASVNTVADAGAWVVFLKEVANTWPTAIALAHATGTGTTAGTASASGIIDGLAIAVDTRLSATSGVYPANETNWTSIATGQTGPGALTYYAPGRIRSMSIAATGTVSATTQTTNGSGIALLLVESPHTTSGTLTGQSSTVSGTAAHKTLHATSGTLTGQGSVIAGTADHSVPAHDTSGALAGQGSSVVGSATRFRAHATSGTLAGPGSALAGTALRFRIFSTTGVLTGQGTVIAGTAAHTAAGTFETSGALIGQGAVIAGTSLRYRIHAASGVLTGAGAFVAGTATRQALHTTAGILSGTSSVLSGTAVRTPAPVTHVTSGGLVGSGAELVGVAIHVVPGEQTVVYSGGFEHERRPPTKAERRKQRQQLGILPPEVEQKPVVLAVEPKAASVSQVASDVKELPSLSPEAVQELSATLTDRILAGPLPKDFLNGRMPPEVPTVLITAPKGMPEADLAFIAASLLMH